MIASERTLSITSVVLSALCLAMAIHILLSRTGGERPPGPVAVDPPNSVTAWIGGAERGCSIAVFHREDDPELRRRRDRSLAEALGLGEAPYTFLELLLVAGEDEGEALGIGASATVSLTDPGREEVLEARPVGGIVGVSGEQLAPGSRLIMEQMGGAESVAPGQARRLVLGTPRLVDLEEVGGVSANLEAGRFELQRREVAPGTLDDMIRELRDGASR